MTQKKIDTKEKALLKQLQSKNEKEILQAVKSIKSHGSIHAVQPLLDCWNNTSSPTINDEIQEVFASLKISNAQPIIIEVLLDKTYQPIHQSLLNALWQSGISYADYISKLTEVAVKGNYMEAFECLTIIENLDGPFEESEIMDAIWVIKNNKEHIEDTARPMIDELEKVLHKINNQL